MSLPVPPRIAPDDRHLTVAVVAALVSLLVHFALYRTVSDRTFAFFDPLLRKVRETVAKPPAPTRTDLLLPETQPPPLDDPLLLASSTKGFAPPAPEVLLERLSSSTPATLFEPPAGKPDPRTAALLERLAPPPAQNLPVWQPRVEILSIANPAARNAMAPFPRREIPRIERQRLAPDVTAAYDLLAGLSEGAAPSADELPVLTSPLSVVFDPDAGLPSGGQEALPEPRLGPEAEGETSTALMAEIPAAVAPAYPLEDRLRITVETYAPARGSDGYLYFRIHVFRKDGEALPGLPRDIVFVQDTSDSLGERYLTPCRNALLEALATLRPQDRFNVVQFSRQASRCFADWQAPTPEAFAQASAFVSAMTSDGTTDLFGSVSEILSLPRTPGRPALALIMTDGHATAGHLERDSQIIGAFTRLNGGEVSVFTVGTSPRANRFLLDMLSYCNRGGHTEIARDRFSVADAILGMNRSILRPLLAGVRFNFDVVSGAEVYPALTTNLYEDRPLQLFGRVRADQPVVAFQARGEAGPDRYDMLFEVDLLGPESLPGGRDLRTLWATQRMYDLVARFARTEDPTLIADMQRLGAAFGIPVPYRSRLGEPASR